MYDQPWVVGAMVETWGWTLVWQNPGWGGAMVVAGWCLLEPVHHPFELLARIAAVAVAFGLANAGTSSASALAWVQWDAVVCAQVYSCIGEDAAYIWCLVAVVVGVLVAMW